MAIIKQVLARYDIASVQELSQKPRPPSVCGENTESVICAARPDAADFTVHASPYIGDEQYVVMTRNGVATATGAQATYPDDDDIHSRSPHAFEFSVTAAGSQPWYVVVAGTHTKPDDATAEINNFKNVMAWMRENFNSHAGSHYILAGDFNADGRYYNDDLGFPFSQLVDWPGYKLLVSNELDTTVAENTYTYDRIIVDTELADVAGTGTAAVLPLDVLDLSEIRAEGCRDGYVPTSVCDQKYDGIAWGNMPANIKRTLAKEVSDHHPVEVCLGR
jgi:endonuclease/exonuclease/phosphatase family metal-dependent hydrolase